MPKLLALDLDGTTFGMRTSLSEGNRRSLQRAHERGVVICFVTGRKTLRQIRHVRELADYIVLSNGSTALAMPSGEPVYTTLVSRADTRRLIDFCNRNGIVLHVLTEGYWGVNLYTPQVAEQEKRYENRTVLYRSADDLPPQAVDGFIANGECPVLQQFIKREKLDLCCVQTSPDMVDIMPGGVNKWHGVQEIARREGVPADEIYAAGNYYNDLEMILGAAVGIAVRNAPDDVKAHADYVTAATNCEDAVAEIVEKFLLG